MYHMTGISTPHSTPHTEHHTQYTTHRTQYTTTTQPPHPTNTTPTTTHTHTLLQSYKAQSTRQSCLKCLTGFPALILCVKVTQSRNTILISRLADQSKHTGLIGGRSLKTQAL